MVDSAATPTRTYPVLSVSLDVGHGDRWRALKGCLGAERVLERLGERERGRKLLSLYMQLKKQTRDEKKSVSFVFFPPRSARLDFDASCSCFAARSAAAAPLENDIG